MWPLNLCPRNCTVGSNLVDESTEHSLRTEENQYVGVGSVAHLQSVQLTAQNRSFIQLIIWELNMGTTLLARQPFKVADPPEQTYSWYGSWHTLTSPSDSALYLKTCWIPIRHNTLFESAFRICLSCHGSWPRFEDSAEMKKKNAFTNTNRKQWTKTQMISNNVSLSSITQ